MPCVYMATNTVNGKRYIGATKFTLRRRKKEHLRAESGCHAFAAAIKKYGPSVFSWECISEHSDVASAFSAEKELIATLKPEYNLAPGRVPKDGEVTPRFWRVSPERLIEAKKAIADGMKKASAKISYAVVCETDGRVYKSVCEAARHYKIPFSSLSSSIRRDGTTHGLKFMMVDPAQSRATPVLKKKPFRRKVVCIDTGETFCSLAEASKHYGIRDTHISEICSGKKHRKTAGGLVFRYAEAA